MLMRPCDCLPVLSGMAERCYAGGRAVPVYLCQDCPCPDELLDTQVPWTVFDVEGGTALPFGSGGDYAEKVIAPGLVITARILARSHAVNDLFTGTLQGDFDTNALGNRLRSVNGAFITMEFNINVVQGDTVVRIIDLDSPASGHEYAQAAAGSAQRRNADTNTLIIPAPVAAATVWDPVNEYWESPGPNNTSSELTFFGDPWGGSAGPTVWTFGRDSGPNSGGFSGSMFDFGGTIDPGPCGQAGDIVWVNTFTGAVVDSGLLESC